MATLKDACKRQLRDHNPGIIQVCLDTSLFGLGDLRRLEVIQKVLDSEIQRLFGEYTRIWKVVIDLMSEPEGEQFHVEAKRLVATNPGQAVAPKSYVEPRAILLV